MLPRPEHRILGRVYRSLQLVNNLVELGVGPGGVYDCWGASSVRSFVGIGVLVDVVGKTDVGGYRGGWVCCGSGVG